MKPPCDSNDLNISFHADVEEDLDKVHADTSTNSFTKKWLRRDRNTGETMFTKLGQIEFMSMAEVGCKDQEIADMFCVDLELIEKSIAKGGQLYDINRRSRALFAREVRTIQLASAKDNASTAKLLGQVVLQQTTKEPDANPEHAVIGALPDWKATPDDWSKQFKPLVQDTTSTIDKIRARMTAENKKAAQAEDTPTGEASK
jgi:hypothetical protein